MAPRFRTVSRSSRATRAPGNRSTISASTRSVPKPTPNPAAALNVTVTAPGAYAIVNRNPIFAYGLVAGGTGRPSVRWASDRESGGGAVVTATCLYDLANCASCMASGYLEWRASFTKTAASFARRSSDG